MVKKDKNTGTAAEAKVSKKEVKSVEKVVEDSPVVTTEKKVATKVGAMLKNMRLEKGLKVADIAKVLCIRKQYLEAIEDSDYEEIPAFPYGVGFIRSYAEFLGLNSSNIVELYKEETNIEKVDESTMVEPQSTSAMPNMTYIFISLLAIILVYGGWHLFSSDNDIDTNTISEALDESDNVVIVEETLDTDIEPTTVSETEDTLSKSDVKGTVRNEQPLPADTTQSAESVSSSENVINNNEQTPIKPAAAEEAPVEKLVIPSKGIFIEVVEESWVEVKNELKLYLSKVLKAGEGYTLPNDKGLILSVGKRNGVNVYVNGVKTDLTHTGKKMNIDIDEYLQSLQ